MEESEPIKNNKHKIVIYFILAIILIAGFYFTVNYTSNPKFTGNNKAKESEKPPEETGLYWQEKADEIIKTNDFSKCEQIEDELYKKVCINNIALNLANKNLDISYCQRLDNELISIADCESQVIYAKAFEEEDIAVCGETENQELQKNCEDSFYLSLALKKEDISICGNEKDEIKQNNCHNTYLVQKEFSADTAGFDCKKLKGRQEQADCETFKKDIAENNFNNCVNLKSELFGLYCQMRTLYNNRSVF